VGPKERGMICGSIEVRTNKGLMICGLGGGKVGVPRIRRKKGVKFLRTPLKDVLNTSVVSFLISKGTFDPDFILFFNGTFNLVLRSVLKLWVMVIFTKN
jgi:hypothetical protein